MRPQFALDLAVVAVFAAIGRVSHGEALDPAGWWHTAWPFGFGLVFGWLVLLRWRAEDPTRGPLTVRGGAVVLAATVAGGMLIRASTGQGTAAAFVAVATVFLAAGLLGSRAIRARALRARG